MIDPMISLAFAMHANPGAYALLLGSGTSRAAGIPTGWEVVTDLIEQVAQLQGEDTSGEPAAWFRNRFNVEPSYSALLAELAAEPGERNRLLRAYFEPNEEEREQGLKVPTAGHRAIARLVEGGYVRVIVTTNFDRLLERALEELGVVPTMLATPDAVEGALPLAHTNCTIVKVHGDYVDARIRNTPDELVRYDERIDRLLDRIFDEYGLVVCGWSAEWDAALRDAIARAPTRRFTTYWTSRGELSAEARGILENRRGVLIKIRDADAFFGELEEKIQALAEVEPAHPLSAKAAVATMKRYLADDRYRIRLHDLVSEELRRVEEATSVDAMPVQGSAALNELQRRLRRYEAICETLMSLMAVGGYWADREQVSLLTHVLERLSDRWREPRGGTVVYIELLDYPTALSLYAAGLGALAANRLDTLARVLGDVSLVRNGERRPLLHVVAPAHVVDRRILQRPQGEPHLYTPVNDYLANVLREPLRELEPNDEAFTRLFDRFEYLLSIAYADLSGEDVGERAWVPPGSYAWRQRRWRGGEALRNQLEEEAREAGGDWPLLQGPLFRGSVDRFLEVKRAADAHIASLGIF